MKASDAIYWFGLFAVFCLPLGLWKAVEILGWIFDKL